MKQTFQVTGMTCSACSAHVEKAVGKLAGVESCPVNLMMGSMTVTYDEQVTNTDQIISAVIDAGYGAQRAEESDHSKLSAQQDSALRAMRRRLVWSIICLIPLFYLAMGHMMGLPVPHWFFASETGLWSYAGIQIALLIPILLLNRTYFTVGFSRLFKGAPNMDTLVALGAAAGIVYSLITLVAGVADYHMPDFYFESAGMILTLVTVGKFLEQRSRSKTTGAISALLALAPDSAVIKRDGKEITVGVEEIQIGDIVVVRQGSKIGVDGVVISGHGAVDESALTGESLPVDKEPGSHVSAGTVNQSGYLLCRASRVGEDSTLAQIIRMVSDAAATKAPIAKIADQVSGIFVPTVLCIALVTLIVWLAVGESFGFALARAISVLVISCPCALGLATPVAIMVGSGVGARSGILFKTAVSLENAGKAEICVLDKTGTVTRGKPAVTDLVTADIPALLSLAASVEASSTHPLAHAVLQEAERRGIRPAPVEQAENLPGFGLVAKQGQRILAAGNARLMEKLGVDTAPVTEKAVALEEQGKTLLYFAENGALSGLIAVADPVKPDSEQAVRQLRELGCKVVILTGDNARTADAVCKAVGADYAIAQVLPQDKEAHIRALQDKGEVVAMVGDGINDAPALTRAEVGFAIGGGTDVAIESADVVLTGAQLTAVPQAIRLSRAVLRIIKQNLFWAFFYNAIGIPVAAGVLYPAFGITLSPMIGSAAMSLSSFCVVTNALRLTRLKLKENACPESCALSEEPQTEIEETVIPKEEPAMTKTMKIQGMMCPHCVAHVHKALTAIPGVTADVQLANNCAVITMEQPVEDAVLVNAVVDAGDEAQRAE